MNEIHKTQLRVRYADTDQMGVVYYTRYLEWTEVARTEFFRSHGLAYSKIEEMGFAFPLVNCNCNYKKPTKYDDLIIIETTIKELRNTSVTFEYKLTCEGNLVAEASTTHVCVSCEDFKPVRIPAEISQIFS